MNTHCGVPVQWNSRLVEAERNSLLRWRSKLGNAPPWWTLILFAASPVSLMISGFHGNVDPVMVATSGALDAGEKI